MQGPRKKEGRKPQNDPATCEEKRADSLTGGVRNWHEALTKDDTANGENLNRAVRSISPENRTASAHLGRGFERRRKSQQCTITAGKLFAQCIRQALPANFKITMAYMNQERKAQLSPAIKAHCRKFGMKASIAVRHHSTLVVNIKSGKLPLVDNYYDTVLPEYAHRYPSHTLPARSTYIDVNPYHAQDHFTGKCRTFILELLRLMNIGNHDNSDPQTDYFDVGWYKDVNIGAWNKPYQVIE